MILSQAQGTALTLQLQDIPVSHGISPINRDCLPPLRTSDGQYQQHLADCYIFRFSRQHVGIRSAMGSWGDYENDYEVGFVILHAKEMEEIRWRGDVKKIRDTVSDNPIYSG